MIRSRINIDDCMARLSINVVRQKEMTIRAQGAGDRAHGYKYQCPPSLAKEISLSTHLIT